MDEISIWADNALIGVAQSINVEEKKALGFSSYSTTAGRVRFNQSAVNAAFSASAYAITVGRIRFDQLAVNAVFGNNMVNATSQKTPLQISAVLSSNEMRITNAWITNIQYTYQSTGWTIADPVEMEAESIQIIDRTKINVKCKHCLDGFRGHDILIKQLEADSSKENVLEYLGIIPRKDNISPITRARAIETIRGHFPDVYNSMMGLFILQ